MSTAQKTLIDAIRRIALDSEALASALGDLQKRGVIDGIKTTLGGYNELQDDCCTEGDGVPSEDDVTDELPDIDGDAPPFVPGIGEEDVEGDTGWTDCETGEPISFAPGGFPRPETCKDCNIPDPDWQAGYYWVGRLDIVGQIFASPGQAYAAWPRPKDGYTVIIIGPKEAVATTSYSGPGGYSARFALRSSCPFNPSDPDVQAACSVTEAPVIEGCEDWESDSTTSYTLVNGWITASSCDPDASVQSQQCNECITICNEDGEERRVCAIGNGQWILYDPNGKYKGGRYDATGRRLEILPAGETGGYLPSERNPTGDRKSVG